MAKHRPLAADVILSLPAHPLPASLLPTSRLATTEESRESSGCGSSLWSLKQRATKRERREPHKYGTLKTRRQKWGGCYGGQTACKARWPVG